MTQITDKQRAKRIDDLLRALNKIPPEKHEVEQLPPTSGEPMLCEVITIGVDEVLLNHNSHRVKAQLEDAPDWQELKSDPHSDAAQRLIERHVRDARKQDEFNALKESLINEGQSTPGVITHEGVLINANTRAVAIREGIEDPSKRVIRVAVLPEHIKAEELALLELRLQMRKELKVDYTLTNELLFIEELSNQRGLSDGQIATELRVDPEHPKKAEKEIALRLQMLDLIRELQTMPEQRLPLTFFDRLSYQHFRDLLREYRSALEEDPNAARQLLVSYLLSVSVGVTSVHQIRRVDESFMTDYMLPQLEDDEEIGQFAEQLVSGDGSASPEPPAGVTTLSGKDVPEENGNGNVDVARLVNLVTQRDKRVEVPGTPIILERDDVAQALNAAITTGVKEKRRDEKSEDKLEAPLEAIKAARKQVDKCADTFKSVRKDSEFDDKRRRSLEMNFKKLKRNLRSLEDFLTDEDILQR